MQSTEPNGEAIARPAIAAAHLRALFDNRLIGADLVDAEGRWVDVNGRLCELLGMPREQLVGRLVEDFSHPDDAEADRVLFRRVLDGESSHYGMQKRLLRNDGRWFRVEIDVSLVDRGEAEPWRASVVLPIADRSEEADEAARYRALMGQSPLSVVVVDPQTETFLDFNDAACDALGYTRPEFAGLCLTDVYAAGEGDAIRMRIDLVMEQGQGRFEARHRTKQGEVRQVTVHSRRIRSEGRSVVQSIWQDVTPLRKAAEDKARHDALVRQILHCAPLPMGIVELATDDRDVLHVLDNPATCRSLELDLGATAGRWDGADFGVSRSTLDTWIAAYRASQRLGHAVHFEDCHDQGGGPRWLGVVVSHVGPGAGGRERFCYIAEDITERKRAEEEILRLNRSLERQAAELQTVFEVLPIGIGIADDPECRSIRANPTLSEMLRRPTGANVSMSAPEPERPTSFRLFRDGRELTTDELPMQVSARDGANLRNVGIDVRFDDGRVVHLLEHVAPLFDERGNPRGSVGAFLDVTERRLAEQERERLLMDLRDADRRKDEFLAMLAHELRSPLSAAGNAAQILLMKGQEDPDVLWCSEVIQRQTRRLARLLDDLLDVSRISRGKIVLRREPVDLRGVVERAVETTRPMVEEKRHRVEVRLPDDPLAVVADPARMEQVVVNLLGNAAKYSEEGRTIAIVVGREGGEAMVRVEDQGVGMTPEVLARVFDMYAQAESSIDRSQGGLGIGLTICKSLVEMHGGSIAATSPGPGRGSVFTVRLPAFDRPHPMSNASWQPTVSSVKPRRVVVVDDNVDAVESLGRMLRLAGHEVRTASNGPGALDAVAEFRPDVVFLDLGLPGLDGYEVATRLRGFPEGRAALIVALTGYGREVDRRRAFDAGFDRHMIKPVDFQAILAAIESASADA
ncbi:hybrid sensor histidine kinase/response regulator [Paludisphaera mucosa]|uniref:histidine kinase n=1 Tax=Paludisphaera mucosa TaxID=3030827 RepID=A0ABT6F7E2_9BACT|nr:PAS domain S-box protein [Paludisphaera mucosa]MDG3003401.1 PAS domain S-box protein [Paludisphaera mucosa]